MDPPGHPGRLLDGRFQEGRRWLGFSRFWWRWFSWVAWALSDMCSGRGAWGTYGPSGVRVRITNPRGFFPGAWEVISQNVVVRNRPWVGLFHLPLFFGLLAFLFKSLLHVMAGLGMDVEAPDWYNRLLDVVAIVVLVSVVFLAIRRYFVERERMTHPLESGIILALISLLMITHLLEQVAVRESAGGMVNWWGHLIVLAVFPVVIAQGKHLHLVLAPVNVVLKHMTELPSDRPVFGNDLVMDLEDESKLEAEYARLGMPGGVADFSFGALFDQAACIQCGRCNDACPAGPALKPRDHFVLALQTPTLSAEQLATQIDADVAATCVQCRACEVACPTGCRPGRNALEIRGRLMLEGLYPPRALRDTAMKALTSSGNIFGVDGGERARFIKENDFPIYDASIHDVLFVLGCQGGNSPEVQPAVVATASFSMQLGSGGESLPRSNAGGRDSCTVAASWRIGLSGRRIGSSSSPSLWEAIRIAPFSPSAPIAGTRSRPSTRPSAPISPTSDFTPPTWPTS